MLVKSHTPLMSTGAVVAVQVTEKAAEAVWPATTSTGRGLAAPTGAQFGASPARSTLWLPALSPDSVTVPFDGMTRPAPPSMATL